MCELFCLLQSGYTDGGTYKNINDMMAIRKIKVMHPSRNKEKLLLDAAEKGDGCQEDYGAVWIFSAKMLKVNYQSADIFHKQKNKITYEEVFYERDMEHC